MKVENAIEQHLAAVEALTAFLDETDGDPDTEDGADHEPSLAGLGSSHSPEAFDQRHYAMGNDDDREHDDERDQSFPETHGRGSIGGATLEDDEHSLGWTDAPNQDRAIRQMQGSYTIPDTCGEQWARPYSDVEAEHDGREPSLGSIEGRSGVDQRLWGCGVSDDREFDLDMNEAGEEDEHNGTA